MAGGTIRYMDAACALPGYNTTDNYATDGNGHIYALGPLTPSEFKLDINNVCVAAPPFPVRPRGAEVPLDSFVKATIETEP